MPARYEDLEVADRVRHGGAHMSVESSVPHLQQLLASGQTALVAEIDTGGIVGELELFVGREADWGRTAHIDLLEVHSMYRRQGVGRSLVKVATALGADRHSDRLSTNAEASAVPFYQRCGLEETFAHIRFGTLDTESVAEERPAPVTPGIIISYQPLERRRMVLGRFQTGFAEWVKHLWTIPGVTDLLRFEEGRVEELDAYYRIQANLLRPDVAVLWAWSSVPGRLRQILASLTLRARQLGFSRVGVAVDVKAATALAGLPIQWEEEHVFMGRRLR